MKTKLPTNFLRTEGGTIVNAALVRTFSVKAGIARASDDKPAREGYHVIGFFGEVNDIYASVSLRFCETEAEANAELGRVYERLTGWIGDEPETDTEETVTHLAAPVKNWNGGPDPFAPDPINSDSDDDRTTHTCGEVGNTCCHACEEEAFAE